MNRAAVPPSNPQGPPTLRFRARPLPQRQACLPRRLKRQLLPQMAAQLRDGRKAAPPPARTPAVTAPPPPPARMPEPFEREAVWAAPPLGGGIVDAHVWEEGEDAFALDLLSDVEVMPAELPSPELPVPVVLPDSLEQDRMESCLKRG